MIAATQTQIARTYFHGASIFDHVVLTAARWMARSRQRHHLSTLSTRELEDVGISADAAATEAAKLFWKA